MKHPDPESLQAVPEPPAVSPERASYGSRRFPLLAGLVTIAFAWPLFEWLRLAFRTDYQSHILLVPFIFWYLVKTRRKNDEASERLLLPRKPSYAAAAVAALPGLGSLAAWWGVRRSGALGPDDALTFAILAYLLFLLAAKLAVSGWPAVRANLFATAFLGFMIPMPAAVIDGASILLQRASAEGANITFQLTGMPIFRDGLAFQLPGLRILVAEECSGIRSTLVLFITSLLGSHLFLQRGWTRTVFVLAVLPLGILRNAVRITLISWLTVNVDSRIIDSAFHHRGGPIFFAISLVPLFLLLWWLRKIERRQRR